MMVLALSSFVVPQLSGLCKSVSVPQVDNLITVPQQEQVQVAGEHQEHVELVSINIVTIAHHY